MKPCPYCDVVLSLFGVRVNHAYVVQIILQCLTCTRFYMVWLQGQPTGFGTAGEPPPFGHLMEVQGLEMDTLGELLNPFELRR